MGATDEPPKTEKMVPLSMVLKPSTNNSSAEDTRTKVKQRKKIGEKRGPRAPLARGLLSTKQAMRASELTWCDGLMCGRWRLARADSRPYENSIEAHVQ